MFFKYYSRAGYAIFMFMISCFFLVGKVPAQAESDFPINTVLIKEEVLKLNPSLNILKWPKDEQIRRLEVKVRDIDLIKLIAREKIEKIIKQKYIPSDICDRFIPLRNYIKGCGALLVRYRCREFLIQLTITSANARIVIREEKSSIRETDQGKLRFVQEVMEKFFNEDDILLKTDYGPVARKGGLEGKIPKQTPTTTETEIRLRWYDTLYWWTDGEIACFWVCFSPGSSGGCVDQKNWFANVLSLEKGLRTKKGKLTQEMIDKVLRVKSGLKEYVPVRPNETAETPKEKRMIMENLPGQVGMLFKWPDLKTIPSDKLVTGIENKYTLRAKRSTIRWIYKVIDPKWLPESKKQLEERLTMIKDVHNSIDATYVEWEKNQYRFRITQSKTVLTIIVTPTTDANAVSGHTLQEKIASASAICTQIVRNIPKVEVTTEDKEVINIVPQGTTSVLLAKTFNQGMVKQCDDGIVGQRARVDWKDELDRRSHEYWWGRMGWWTDGRKLGLYTLKIENGAWEASYSPGVDYRWFEGPKRPKTDN